MIRRFDNPETSSGQVLKVRAGLGISCLPLFFWGLLLLCSCFCQAQNTKADSLLILIKKDKEDTNKVKHLNDLGWQLKNNNPDTSFILGAQALSLGEKLQWKKGIANSLGNFGYYNYLIGDYQKALDYYLKALKINEEMLSEAKNPSEKYAAQKGISKRLGNIGIVYWNQGDYPKALDYYLKALKIDETLNNKKGIAAHLGNIGLVYLNQADHLKALDYYLKALKMEEELGNKNGIELDLGNIGNVYLSQAEYSKTSPVERNKLLGRALDYYFKALKIAEELEDNNGITIWLSNIGNIYLAQNDRPKALDYYFKASEMAEELGNKNSVAINLANIGSVYTEQNKYKDAYHYLYRALAISDSIGSQDQMKAWYEMLTTLYEKSNIPLPDSVGGQLLNKEQMRLRALYYYKCSIEIRDTLFSEENKKQLVRKEMNFGFEKKEAETKAEQDKKDAVAEANAKRQRVVLILVSFVLFLVAAVAFIVFRSLHITRKQKTLIEKQKQMVEEHQKEILDSIHYAKRIQTALLPTEKYIARILNKIESR